MCTNFVREVGLTLLNLHHVNKSFKSLRSVHSRSLFTVVLLSFVLVWINRNGGKICCPVYFNSQITLKQLKDNGSVLPGRSRAGRQLAGVLGRRPPLSLEPGGGLPASCNTYSQYNHHCGTLCERNQRLALTQEQSFSSFHIITLPHSSAPHLVSLIIWGYRQHFGSAPTWWIDVSNYINLGMQRLSFLCRSVNFTLSKAAILMQNLAREFRKNSKCSRLFFQISLQ